MNGVLDFFVDRVDRRCAETIVFNGYMLVDPVVSPRGVKLGVDDVRRFFNLQALGEGRLALAFHCQGDGIERSAACFLNDLDL